MLLKDLKILIKYSINNNNKNNGNNSSNKNSTTNKDNVTLPPPSQNSQETMFILGDSMVKKLNGFLLIKKTQS